jgi:hypothetical protein
MPAGNEITSGRPPLLSIREYLKRVILLVEGSDWKYDAGDPWRHGLAGALQKSEMRPVWDPAEWDHKHIVKERAIESREAIRAWRLIDFDDPIVFYKGSRHDALILLRRALETAELLPLLELRAI